VEKNNVINYIKSYIKENYNNTYNIKIREIKYDEYTKNWSSHISFNDDMYSHEIAVIINNNKIIFFKEFK